MLILRPGMARRRGAGETALAAMEPSVSKHVDRSTLRLLAFLVIAGLLLTLLNRGLPLVRNSLVYARASENVVAQGYDPRPVVANSRLSYDKPILYPWVSAPFVRAFGNHDGLRITSFATTAAYLIALVYLARSFRSRMADGRATLFLWLCAAGPCVFYQFWSAHPDGWFAALVLLAWGTSERIVAEPGVHTVRRVIGLGSCIYCAILLKNYGLVLLISCPLYLVWHLRRLREDRASFRALWIASSVVFGSIAGLVLLAWSGHNPLSRLEGEGGGVGQYATGELWLSARGAWVGLGLALALQFQIAWIFALRRDAWSKRWIAPLCCFAGTYIACLMPFPTTFYNMRYFLPLFAIAGLILVRGASGMQPGTRRILLVAHGAVATALVLVFNVAPVYR
ncbi:MAG TPA: hypothetical protein VK843_11260, partial [Planctomycetota bacterium]|nr:hypothetical protein [Planctomycetota bacterium]